MATHQGYGRVYGQQALSFVMSRINGLKAGVFAASVPAPVAAPPPAPLA